jgi:hypothetical protein
MIPQYFFRANTSRPLRRMRRLPLKLGHFQSDFLHSQNRGKRPGSIAGRTLVLDRFLTAALTAL